MKIAVASDHGMVTQYFGHQELLQKKGFYFDMYESQFNIRGKTASQSL